MPSSFDEALQVLTVVVAVPEKRGGAIRAGLTLGDTLRQYVDADVVKMEGVHDDLLVSELDLRAEFDTTPSRTFLRTLGNLVVDSPDNYENTVIWTELSTPRPLESYDVVHVHNAVPLWGLLAVTARCRLAGVPYVYTTHGVSKLPELPERLDMGPLERRLFQRAFFRPYRAVLNGARHLFALSERDADRLDEIVDDPDVSVVPNGVRPFERRPQTHPAIPFSDEAPLLLFVGKVRSSKGIDDLLSAYRALETPAHLVVAGPPDDDDLVTAMREAPDGIRYLGYADRDRLTALYERADLFVFPTRSDVFPLVTLEALAAGTPVVATDVGGIPTQVDERTGVLVEPEQPIELARALDALLTDQERLEAMSTAAAERAKRRFSWDAVARQTVEAYRRIVDSSDAEAGD